jgi:DNA-binding NarL/FixJ family response regulator
VVDHVARFVARPGALRAAVVDLGTSGAGDFAGLAADHDAVLVLLLSTPQDGVAPALLERCDAILLRDDVGPETLRMALTAATLGMRLLPRALRPGAAGHDGPSGVQALGEPAQRAMELLAGGLRDAEIARELNLSESAARKLIQRAVQRLGARTRSQAVAIAARAGALGASEPRLPG